MTEPVVIRHERDHKFVRPEVAPKRGKGRCRECGKHHDHLDHHGAPRSLNVGGSGANHFAYQNAKAAWESRLTELLEESGLPRGLERVLVEGTMCFPTRQRRDQGNFRFMIEKALGDALVRGGWLPDDSWAEYEFGNLAAAHEPGRAWTELVILPLAAGRGYTDRVPESQLTLEGDQP